MPDSRPIVIKYGGSLLEDPHHQREFLQDVVALAKKERVILVHGGGKEITKALEQSGLPTRFVGGRRFTDAPTLAVVERVLAEINMRIVRELKALGILAGGFSGKSNDLMRAKSIAGLGCVGEPKQVDFLQLERHLAAVRIPVYYPVALSANGETLNINADDFAQALAIACRSPRLVFITETGAIRDKEGKPILRLRPDEVEALIAEGTVTGGMMVKARACLEALRKGVGRVDIYKGIRSLPNSTVPLDEGTSFTL